MPKAWTDDVLQFSYTKPEELEPIAAMLPKASVCEHVFFGPNSPEETPGLLYASHRTDAGVFETRRNARRSRFPRFAKLTALSFIGECALLPVMCGDGNYTIGYQLDEPYWGRG